jgi:hypothetical protein
MVILPHLVPQRLAKGGKDCKVIAAPVEDWLDGAHVVLRVVFELALEVLQGLLEVAGGRGVMTRLA